MTISNIQKKKFLDNIYRLMYSTGNSVSDTVVRQPDDREVKKEFDNYFSINRIGLPLSNDINVLRNTPVTNPDLMNLFMSRSLLNMEVLYDSVHENNQEMMKVITVLNKRLESLRSKRVSLEKKIDDLLFANSNTDGYFYSFSETFSNLENVDLSLSSCFVDTANRKATLPNLKSSPLDFNAPGKVNLSNVKYNIIFNGATMVDNQTLPHANNIFDGLNDTTSVVSYSSSNLGPCAMVLTIPLTTPFVVSKIDGRLNTSSSIVTTVEIYDNNQPQNVQFKRKQSNSDYEKFSFDFNPQTSGTIRITLIKYEPDVTYPTRTADKYEYRFEIKDLIISGQYYDKQAILVSSPIELSPGNENKIIDAVSIEAANSNQDSGEINFFVAEDVPGAVNISDFSWIPISSSSSSSQSFDKIISFNKSSKKFKSIKTNAIESEINLLPLFSSGSLSEVNPSNSIYNGISVYRVGIVPEEDSPYNPYMLDSINSISSKSVSYIEGLYKDLSRWSNIINGSELNLNVTFNPNITINNLPSIPIESNASLTSNFLQSNILVEEPQQVNHSISKVGEAIDWNLAVYLNGIKIVDLPAGQVSKDISWNFIQGINKLVVAFDAPTLGSGTVSLMDGVSISNYGIPFLEYYSYVDPFDFKTSRTEKDFVFTIDKYLGNKEILCRSQIKNNSRLAYYTNSINPVEKIRFRADFTRHNNPFGTPVLPEYRIKFKNSNIETTESNGLLSGSEGI
jgi:hypothetical protein